MPVPRFPGDINPPHPVPQPVRPTPAGAPVPAPAPATPSGVQLSGVQVARLAQSVGVPPDQLPTAVAIAWAESGLRTNAVGHNGPTPGCPNGSRDRGLWQINDCYHPQVSDAQAFDALGNAQAMFEISQGGRAWNAWVTYTEGFYRDYQHVAEIAVAALVPVIPPVDLARNLRFMIEHGTPVWKAAITTIEAVFTLALTQAGVKHPKVSLTGGNL